jgi:hypothetical protein
MQLKGSYNIIKMHIYLRLVSFLRLRNETRLNSVMLATMKSRNFVFSSVVYKRKNWNVQNYNFACGFASVWNLVSDIKGET